MEIESHEAYFLDGCNHLFHTNWITMHIQTSIDQNKIPIVCPLEDWNIEIGMDSFRDLLDENYIERFNLFSFKIGIQKNASKFISCPTDDWDYVFWVESDDEKGHFSCPMWKKEYWLECQTKWHKGKKSWQIYPS